MFSKQVVLALAVAFGTADAVADDSCASAPAAKRASLIQFRSARSAPRVLDYNQFPDELKELGKQLFGDEQKTIALVQKSHIVDTSYANVTMAIAMGQADDAITRFGPGYENGEEYGLDSLLDTPDAFHTAFEVRRVTGSKMINMIDMGGNLGVVSISVYKKYRGLVRAVVVEPVPVTYFYLCVNMWLNGIPKLVTGHYGNAQPGISAIQKGISSDASFKLDLCTPTHDGAVGSMNSHLITQERPCDCVKDICSSVGSVTVDSLFEPFGTEDITFMKMDCEGCEKDAMPIVDKKYGNRVRLLAGEMHMMGSEIVDMACKYNGGHYLQGFCQNGVDKFGTKELFGKELCDVCMSEKAKMTIVGVAPGYNLTINTSTSESENKSSITAPSTAESAAISNTSTASNTSSSTNASSDESSNASSNAPTTENITEKVPTEKGEKATTEKGEKATTEKGEKAPTEKGEKEPTEKSSSTSTESSKSKASEAKLLQTKQAQVQTKLTVRTGAIDISQLPPSLKLQGTELMGSEAAFVTFLANTQVVETSYANISMAVAMAKNDDAITRFGPGYENGEEYGLDSLLEAPDEFHKAFESRRLQGSKMLNMIDLGGNLGVVSMAVYKKYQGYVRSVIVEPVPSTFLYLRLNLWLNGIPPLQTGHAGDASPGISVIQKAISSNETFKLDMCTPTHDAQVGSMNSYMITKERPCDCSKDVCVSVPSTTVDSLFQIFGQEDITFLKMDCEGCEKDAMPMIHKNYEKRIRALAGEMHMMGTEITDLACKYNGGQYLQGFCQAGVDKFGVKELFGKEFCTYCASNSSNATR